MNDIEQLRADIATLEAAQRLVVEQKKYGSWQLHDCIAKRQKQLAKLESEAAENELKKQADPWDWEKRLTAIYSAYDFDGENIQLVARYASHLEKRESELEQRLDGLGGGMIDLFAENARRHSRIAELEAELKEAEEEAEQQEAWAATYDSLRIRAENEQRRLEAEIAKRPVVWCAKRIDDGSYYQYLDGPRVFRSLDEANQICGDSKKWQVEPYTGEQK